MRYIGAHVSTAGGVQHAMLNAQSIGANAAALFTRNPRAWHSKPFDEQNIAQFHEFSERVNIMREHILPHASYLINIGSPKEDVREKSIAALRDEVHRAELLNVIGVNFHPGAHLNMISIEQSIALIGAAMNDIISTSDNALLVLENTAGQGSSIGKTFEELADIIALIDDRSRIGVCLDTCHLFSAGYDIRTEHGWEATIDAFATHSRPAIPHRHAPQ